MKALIFLLLLLAGPLNAQKRVAYFYAEHEKNRLNPAWTAAAFSESPFELAGGMVIIQAIINGESGDFILDTGAPGIVLNSKSEEIHHNTVAAGINGQLAIGEVAIDHFQWGIIQQNHLKGFVLDVSHLEDACGREIMGLIGFEVLKNYELLFDYRRKIVRIYQPGQLATNSEFQCKEVIPFALYGHLPVVVAKIGKKRVWLGLDSGAEINLLDDRLLKSLGDPHLSDFGEEFLIGLEQSATQVVAAKVQQTTLRKIILRDMRYVFTDLDALTQQYDVTIDGLLGFPFFKNQIISLDYRNQRICFYEAYH